MIMAKRIAIIQGHPDPSGTRLCHALADSYAEGAGLAGAELHRVEVGRLEFPLLRTQADFEKGKDGIPGTLVSAQQAISSANHLVIVFPLWLGSMPGLLRGFLEQVMRPGVAMDYSEEAFPKSLFTGKSARIVVTMGMPVFFYRWYFGAYGLKSLEKSILGFSGVKPIRETLFGLVESAPQAKRVKWIDQMRLEGQRDASNR